jgi:hypothetical protein
MDGGSAFFTWVEYLCNLTIQEEELVATILVQDCDHKSWLLTHPFLGTHRVGKHHRDGIPGIPRVHPRTAV